MRFLLKCAQTGDLGGLRACIRENYSDNSWSTCFNSKSGDSVPILAARFGHLPILRFLSDEIGAEFLFDHRNFDGKTLLHEAAHFGHHECVEFLLSKGADVDSIKRADWTPLMLSCTKSNLDVVRMLVDHGASTRLVNKDGWNGFHIACREGHSEIVSFLLEQDEDLWKSVSKNGRTPLHTAALHGCADVVRLLLTRCRFDIDVADSCGNTPLMDAARGGHISVLRILVEHGARIDAEDKLGRRCLHIAAESGRQAALSCLIQEYNVDINTPSRVGQTALHYAAKEGHAALVSHLMRNGSDVEKIDRNHRAALHLASGGQHSECVELILLQSTVDKPDINGSTARSLARNSQVISVFDTFS